MVEKFARELMPSSDWDIYLTARNEKWGFESTKEFNDKGLSNVKFHQLDITDPDSRKKFAKFIAENYPDGINILVNNAGVLMDVSFHVPMSFIFITVKLV